MIILWGQQISRGNVFNLISSGDKIYGKGPLQNDCNALSEEEEEGLVDS